MLTVASSVGHAASLTVSLWRLRRSQTAAALVSAVAVDCTRCDFSIDPAEMVVRVTPTSHNDVPTRVLITVSGKPIQRKAFNFKVGS